MPAGISTVPPTARPFVVVLFLLTKNIFRCPDCPSFHVCCFPPGG